MDISINDMVGWTRCFEAVQASLRAYPKNGGITEVRILVDGIVKPYRETVERLGIEILHYINRIRELEREAAVLKLGADSEVSSLRVPCCGLVVESELHFNYWDRVAWCKRCNIYWRRSNDGWVGSGE